MNTKNLKKLFLSAFLSLAVAVLTMLTGIGDFSVKAATQYTPTDWSGVPNSLSDGDILNLSGIINGDASHKTITINSGSETIIGNIATTYINLSIVIQGGAHVSFDNININDDQWDNNSPVVAGDANPGNTLYIEGSNVFTGGQFAAGINVSGSNALIINEAASGSTVKASGGLNGGAGIGGSDNCSGGNITISGGRVQAYSSSCGAGIGGGRSGSGGNITISGGTVTADGNVSGSGSGAGIGGGQNGGSGGTINISGGTVTATGGDYSAGIGGGEGPGGNITISGGTVIATGGDSSAGIGGGQSGSAGNITISGGTVTATGSNSSGIGSGTNSGNSASGGTINISGGIVNAYGNNYGAGIGGGNYVSGGTITISGSSTVNAHGGDQGGAGIGGGNYGSSGNITINGGTVNAYGGSQGAGIGGGYTYGGSGDNGGTITINGGIVTAIGGTDGAGIGGGPDPGFSAGITTNINGGTVTATGGSQGAGIGGGNSNPDLNINISGGKVTATGGQYAAGIGGGYGNSGTYSSGGNINISGGTVTATGGNNGADIGKGSGSYSFSSKFTGGSINATKNIINPSATNGTTSVYETSLGVSSGSKVNSLSVSLNSVPITYSSTDMQTDSNSKLYLFLPVGNASVNLTMDNSNTYGPYKGLVNNSGNTCLGLDQTGFSFDSSTKTNTTKTFGGAQFTVTAAGGQGTGAISYAVTSGSDVVGVGSSTGLVTINKVGTAVITATKAADAIYNSASDTVTITVSPADLAGFAISAIPNQNYTGSAITPLVTVTNGILTLAKNTDYTVSYSNNINAGTATVTITGIGNYSGTTSNTFTIIPANQTGFGFDSSSKMSTTKTYGDPQFTVTAAGGQSTGAISYAVTSGSNVVNVDSSTGLVTIKNAGTGVITATKAADSNYNSASDTVTITVNPADQTGFGFDASSKMSTTKTYGDPPFAVTAAGGQGTGAISYAVTSGLIYADVDSSTGLVTIKYAGTVKITATKEGDSNYNSASDTITININPTTLSGFTISAIPDQTYTGSAIIPPVTVADGTSTLSEDGDYTISYSNNINAGTATVTATGIGNYSGTINNTFYIDPKTGFSVSAIPDQLYTGSAITPTVTVKDGAVTLVKDTDYTVAYSNNINAGNAAVTVTGIGNYSGTVNNTFYINPKGGLSVSAIPDQPYTGSAITPTVTVKDGAVTLVKDTDYTVSYSNNINAGTATVTITGIGNYSGTTSNTFKINVRIIPAPPPPPPSVTTPIPTPNDSTPINGSVTTDSTTGTITTSAHITPTQMSSVTTPNVSVDLGNVQVTAPASVLSNILGSNSTSTLKMNQAASPAETQTAVNTISVMNGVTPVASFDININKVSASGTSTPVHQLGGTVTIIIQLNNEQMAQITDQSKAALLYYDPLTGTFTNMHATFDFTNKTVTFTTDHLSTYVIVSSDKTAPVVTGVSNNGVYHTDETIKFDKGTATLDGAAFTSGGTVSMVGKHTLVVTDAVGNRTTVVFTIDKSSPIITVETNKKMVIKDGCYSAVNVNISISGKFIVTKSVTFNGKAYKWPSNSTFSKEGKYVITVKDHYAHTSNATFIIDKTAPKIMINRVFGGKKITVIETNLSAKYLTLNGKTIAWPKDNKFTKKGAYVITVTDKAGHKTTSKFSI